MKVFKIGIIAFASYMVFFHQSSIWATESQENKFYFVKKINFSHLPDHWISCELKFSEPNPSLNRVKAINCLKFNLTQYYKIDASGNVQVHDLTEVSTWKDINPPSLGYTYHLKGDMRPYRGTKDNIFGYFTQGGTEFGNYIMKVSFLDKGEIDFTFSLAPEKKF